MRWRESQFGTEGWEWDEGICLAVELKREENRKRGERERERERAVGGRRVRGSSPLGQQYVFWGWTEWLCMQNITGHQREGRCQLFSVCVCSETRPTSDPCATHTPPSAAQESAFCFLWTLRVFECVWERLICGGQEQEAVMWNLWD